MSDCGKDKYKDDFAAPLKTAKNLGSAHEGVHHWMLQKITALANIPLVLWLIWSIVSLQGASYMMFTTWLALPINAILMVLLVVSVLYHAVLGAQVIVEDYISNKAFRMFKLIGQKLFFFAMGVACIFSVLKIAFTTPL